MERKKERCAEYRDIDNSYEEREKERAMIEDNEKEERREGYRKKQDRIEVWNVERRNEGMKRKKDVLNGKRKKK